MRNRRRSYNRKRVGAAGSWFLVCCVVLALIITIGLSVPGVKEKVDSALAPVYEKAEQYKDAFTRFGAALSGDKSFTDAFSGILNLGKSS